MNLRDLVRARKPRTGRTLNLKDSDSEHEEMDSDEDEENTRPIDPRVEKELDELRKIADVISTNRFLHVIIMCILEIIHVVDNSEALGEEASPGAASGSSKRVSHAGCGSRTPLYDALRVAHLRL